METLRRRRTFLLLFGVLTGCTAFIIVMLFVIKVSDHRSNNRATSSFHYNANITYILSRHVKEIVQYTNIVVLVLCSVSVGQERGEGYQLWRQSGCDGTGGLVQVTHAQLGR